MQDLGPMDSEVPATETGIVDLMILNVYQRNLSHSEPLITHNHQYAMI